MSSTRDIYRTLGNDSELDYMNAILSERDAEIEKLLNGQKEMNDLFKAIEDVVVYQGREVDNIVNNISDAAVSIKRGNDSLVGAEEEQQKQLCALF